MNESELKALNAQHRTMIAQIVKTDVDPDEATHFGCTQYLWDKSPRFIEGWNQRLCLVEPIWDWICETFPIPDDLDEELVELNQWYEKLLDTQFRRMPFSLQTALVNRCDWDQEEEEEEPFYSYGSGDSGLKFSTIRRW
jgi:hypothetical protein